MNIGAQYAGGGQCTFRVWSPHLTRVELKIASPEGQRCPMEKDSRGYWSTVIDDVVPGTLYYYILDEQRDRPDPASCSQPQGVHGPSLVIDHSSFDWSDAGWKGIALHEMIMYELHVGTFTTEGTFDSIISRLDALKEMGVNSIELMPVAQFPGDRNWGYDGTYLFGVQNSYGGPEGLKRFVNECHRKGMAVILDVVYNHLGPEGNYLWDYGPYFTDRYRTPWGQAINFDGAYSNEVRNFFIENALYWFDHYHIDALRLDAIHGITDMSARPFLLELAERVDEFCERKGRRHLLIAESDLNDSRVTRSRVKGGFGLDGQWCDDFHHCIRTLLTGEFDGYYIDFGAVGHLAKSLKEGFVYSGQYSEYRKRNHGNSSSDLAAGQFVVFSQNHDQIGNRMLGERLSVSVPFESLKLAAGVVLLSPFVPLLFMGEEYGEDAPFLYFISHSDPDLVDAVRKGRKEEFNRFTWKGEPPDPQSVETFMRSKIDWGKRDSGRNKIMMNFYRELITLRKKVPALANLSKSDLRVQFSEEERTLFMTRWKDGNSAFMVFNFGNDEIRKIPDLPEGRWKKVLDSSDAAWDGPGSGMQDLLVPGSETAIRPKSMVLLLREDN